MNNNKIKCKQTTVYPTVNSNKSQTYRNHYIDNPRNRVKYYSNEQKNTTQNSRKIYKTNRQKIVYTKNVYERGLDTEQKNKITVTQSVRSQNLKFFEVKFIMKVF